MANDTIQQHLDQANTRLAQIGALVAVTFGNGLMTFKELTPEAHDSFMWVVSDLVADAAGAVSEAIELV